MGGEKGHRAGGNTRLGHGARHSVPLPMVEKKLKYCGHRTVVFVTVSAAVTRCSGCVWG